MSDLKNYDSSLPSNPYTNVDTTPKSTLGFTPDPMAQTVRDLPGRLLTNADENLTKNITAYTPRPKESQYGSIRMPRMGDDPADAGLFVMAGPIAVEQALGKLAVKALPGKVLENRLLQAGASKAELETRGISAYLESKAAEPVSPLMLMKHLDENPYQLNEITRSKASPEEWEQFHKLADEANKGRIPNTLEGRQAYIDLQKRVELSPKFEGWQTPGGENYREILLQAPSENKGLLLDSERRRAGLPVDFAGGHWDQPNIVAHMRVNDRTLPSGEKALHVEEWQSDWANQLRHAKTAVGEYGFAPAQGAPPVQTSHPLVDNWQDLMARRTIKEAVDGGYDRLTWTTGQQQADRYDLAQHVSAIRYDPKVGALEFLPPNSGGAMDREWQMFRDKKDITPEELPGMIGKGPAEKVLAAKPDKNGDHIISGLDLKVGGEWANKLYDESMVNRFNKFGKQYGVKVEDVPIKGKTMENVTPAIEHLRKTFQEEAQSFPSERTYYNEYVGKVNVMESLITKGEYKKAGRVLDEIYEINTNSIGDALSDIDKALKKVERIPKGKQIEMTHSIKITPEMKESIGASKFHPFADLPGPRPKAPPAPAAIKPPDFHAQAASLDPSNPVRYVGDMGGRPMMQQEPPGVGSFIVQPGETAAAAFERAKTRYRK